MPTGPWWPTCVVCVSRNVDFPPIFHPLLAESADVEPTDVEGRPTVYDVHISGFRDNDFLAHRHDLSCAYRPWLLSWCRGEWGGWGRGRVACHAWNIPPLAFRGSHGRPCPALRARSPPCRETDPGSAQVPDLPSHPSGSGQTRVPVPEPVTLSLALVTVTLIIGDCFSQGALAGVLLSLRSGPGR